MNRLITILVVFIFAIMVTPAILFAQKTKIKQSDTLLVELDTKIRVVGTRISRNSVSFPFEKHRFAEILNPHGFSLVHKGVFHAQDIQVNGFKRGDISIVVDGERYHSACPNRMDSPLARTNSLEMESIDLNKTSNNEQSELGGVISYNRQKPIESKLTRIGLSQAMGSSEATDLGLLYNLHNHRVTGRYIMGKGFDDAKGNSFVDLYGYKENGTYYLVEGSITGKKGSWIYRTELTYTQDMMFPYLMMDERKNRVFSGSVEHNKYKVYFNYTDHTMDNGLRESMMTMVTDATNLTLGLNGDFFELYYRHWNADNEIITPMTSINNHLMPDVRLISGLVNYKISSGKKHLWGRLGVSGYWMDDDNRLDFYKLLNSSAESNKSYALFSLGGNINYSVGEKSNGFISADISMHAPPAEYLYIGVQRPTGKAWWIGNPTLKSPIRTSLRFNHKYHELGLETFVSYVWNYANLFGVSTIDRDYRSYNNIDAVFLGLNMFGNWKYFDFSAGYTWAENKSTQSPMVEIQPFTFVSNFKLPDFNRISSNIRFSYNDKQTRIDESLMESSTSSWYQLDLGINYQFNSIKLSINLLNLTNEQYYQHLSYLRNPYSNGMAVNEPGRTIMINLYFDSLLE